MRETHQGVPEEFIFGIVLPEEEFTVAAHGGLNLNHQLMVLQTSLCTGTHRQTALVTVLSLYCPQGYRGKPRFKHQFTQLQGLFLNMNLFGFDY